MFDVNGSGDGDCFDPSEKRSECDEGSYCKWERVQTFQIKFGIGLPSPASGKLFAGLFYERMRIVVASRADVLDFTTSTFRISSSVSMCRLN